ncbi:hypothetical protein I312_102379 [Cryptococcus bacillisporus CA1280]|uniref:uncharacterized protein n=1 Tax=Cryptococcus bacillisporus CA1280 TaxID=1296109 RepID=UPI0033664272
MLFLRRAFLQDAPHIRQRYPSLFIWDNPLFQDPLYLSHEARARQMANDFAVQASLMLRDALPELVNLVSTNFASINQTLRGFDDRVSQELVSAAVRESPTYLSRTGASRDDSRVLALHS